MRKWRCHAGESASAMLANVCIGRQRVEFSSAIRFIKDRLTAAIKGSVGRRHRIVAQLGRRAPISAPGPRGPAAFPASAGRHRAASAGGSRRRRGWRRSAARGSRLRSRCRAPPASSRISAASGVSPVSTLPPGNSHSPAIGLPSGRCAISTRPSTIDAARRRPTEERSASRPIVAVDGDVFLGEVAGPDPVARRCRGRDRP